MGDCGRVRIRHDIAGTAQRSCDRAWVELEDVLRDTIAALRGQAARKRLALRLSMPPDLPILRGHAEQLFQFFAALFSVAIENTPDGGRVSLDIERGEGCAIVLSIAGSGTDVLCEEIEAIARLFVRFGSLQSDSAAGPEIRVTLRWPRERWRGNPCELSVAPGFW